MLLWHVGGTILIARYVFRDPGMDLRWVALGSILPDLIDKPIASILFHDTFQTHRIFGHALVFPVLLMVVGLVATTRGTAPRRAVFGVVLGVFVHLVLDGAWTAPEGFLWPFFGWTFPPVAGSDFPTLVHRMITDPWVWAGEAAGLGYLVYLWRRYLAAPGALGAAVRTGRVPMPGVAGAGGQEPSGS